MQFTVTFFLLVSIAVSALSFLFAAWLYQWVKNRPSSNKRIAEVGTLIKNGANTFLTKEYTVLAKFAGVAAILILILLPAPIWKSNPFDNLVMALA